MKRPNLPRRSSMATAITLALGTPIASADVFTVDNDSDDVNTPGSLRWAIDQANNNNNPAEIDRIDFDNINRISVGSYLPVTESLRLNGPGISELTLDNDGANPGLSRMIVAENGSQPIEFEISGLRLQRQTSGDTLVTHASAFGGGLRLSNVDMVTTNATGRSITS